MLLFAFLISVATIFVAFSEASFKVGSGIYDITGPAAEINFMGYAGYLISPKCK